MKKCIYRIAVTFMAFLLLLSTMSFTVKHHYCCGSLVAISLGDDVEICEVPPTAFTSVQRSNCCQQEVQHIEGQEVLQYEKSSSMLVIQQALMPDFSGAYNFRFLRFKDEKQYPKNLIPPNINKNLQVLYQVFLT